MRADQERIVFPLTAKEAELLYGNREIMEVNIRRCDNRRLLDDILNGKHDRPHPRWWNIETKLRREAIFGDKWRTKDQWRMV